MGQKQSLLNEILTSSMVVERKLRRLDESIWHDRVQTAILVAFVILLFVGCLPKAPVRHESQAPVKVWTDSKTIRHYTRIAMDLLNGQAGCIVLAETKDPHRANAIVRNASPHVLGGDCADPGVDGCALEHKTDHWVVHVKLQTSGMGQALLIAHELGHVLGLENDEFVKLSLMAGGVSSDKHPRLSPPDLAYVRRRWCR